MLMRKEKSSLTDFFFCLNQTVFMIDLKGQHNLYCSTSFRCGEPCYLVGQLVLFTYGKYDISPFVSLPHLYCDL